MMSDELKQVDVRLKLVEGNGVYSDKPITNPQEAISVMADVMAGLDREEVCVINLDSKGHPINFNVVSIGTLNSAFVSGRELCKSAILSNAASMILLHNHPSSELQMSQSDRMVTEKMMYASLFLDIEILDHIIVAGRTGDTLSIRETYPEIFDKSTYVNAIVRVADGVEERENSYDAEGLATYELFQIKEGGNGQAYQFMGMDFVKKNKLVVDKADYESVYRGEIKEGETLDTLYEKFNLYHPDDFTGHSMSVSDVIVIEKEHDKTAYYVDSFGFTKVADFLGEKKYHSAETEQVVSRFREKTKQYFRPIEGMTADRIEEDVREYIQMKIRKYHLPIQIREVMVYGSRSRGTEKADSDLDILFEYAGAWREDDIFNLLHEDDFCIGEVKVDINPVTEEISGDFSERLIRAEEYMEQELVFGIEDRYIFAQSVDEGYDYTIYDMDGKELDGGVYDNPDISIYEAVNDIVEDLKQKPDTNGTKGAITAESELYPLNCEEFLDELERKSKVEPVLTFTVAECGEFHQLGEYYDDITTVEEAIEKWEQLKDSPLNGVASIGILSHKPGENSLEDEQVDLVTGKVLDLDMLRYYPAIRNDKRALEMIAALASHLPDIGVIGEIPYELSLQMMLYELDPEKEIFSEDERTLIEEYALQFRDMNRSRELAERICYQEEYGNQDVAPVVIEARREIQEKKEEHLQQKKR